MKIHREHPYHDFGRRFAQDPVSSPRPIFYNLFFFTSGAASAIVRIPAIVNCAGTREEPATFLNSFLYALQDLKIVWQSFELNYTFRDRISGLVISQSLYPPGHFRLNTTMTVHQASSPDFSRGTVVHPALLCAGVYRALLTSIIRQDNLAPCSSVNLPGEACFKISLMTVRRPPSNPLLVLSQGDGLLMIFNPRRLL